MKTDTTDQQINNQQPKQEWSKPKLTLMAINSTTLGDHSHGGDTFGSLS